MAENVNQKINGNNNSQIINVYGGIQEKEAREISRETAHKVIEEYFQSSQTLATKRIKSFENEFIDRINKLEKRFDSLKEPDFVMAYRKAQISAAKTDEDSAYKMLSELLIHRDQNSKNQYKKTGVDGAIEIVNQLSDQSLSALTVLVCIETGIAPASNDLNEGLKVLNDLYSSILKNGLPHDENWMDQLDVLKAVRINTLSSFIKFDVLIGKIMPGYLAAGIKKDSEDYQKARKLQEDNHLNVLIPHPLNNNFYIVPVINKNQIMSLSKIENGTEVSLNDVEKNCCRTIYDLYSKVPDDLKEAKIRFSKKIDTYPSLKKLHEWWDSIKNSCNVTMIGKVLGHTNAKKCFSGFPDLD